METKTASHEQGIQSLRGVGNPTSAWRAVCGCGHVVERDTAARANTAALAHSIKTGS